MSSFNPWKKAKQQRNAVYQAEAFFEAQKAAGAFWQHIEDDCDVSVNLQAVDGEGNAFGYFTSVHSFYDLVAEHPELKEVEALVADVLNGIVAKNNNVALTQLLNDPVVILHTNSGVVVMPKVIRFYDLGNDQYRFGEAATA
jgi:hypothetical protein